MNQPPLIEQVTQTMAQGSKVSPALPGCLILQRAAVR